MKLRFLSLKEHWIWIEFCDVSLFKMDFSVLKKNVKLWDDALKIKQSRHFERECDVFTWEIMHFLAH